MGTDRTEVLSSRGDVEALEEEWIDFEWQAESPTPFLHPAYVSLWLRTLGKEEDPRVITLRTGGRLVGYAPFIEVVEDFGFVSLRTLRFVGNNVGYPGDILYSDVLAIPPETEKIRRIFSHAKTNLGAKRWDLGFLDPASTSFFAASEILAARDRFSTHHQPYVRIDLPESWEAYLRTLSRYTVQNMRRKSRKLDALGDVELNLDRSPAKARQRVQEVFRNHDRFWKGTDRASWFGDRTTRKFAVASTGLLADQGRFLAFTLKLNGKSIAWNLGAFDGTRYYEQISGHDRSFAPYSPGVILHILAMRELVSLGAHHVALGPGMSKRKLALGGREEERVRVQGYPGLVRNAVRIVRPMVHQSR